MPLRLVLEFVAAGCGAIGAMVALLSVERGELPAGVMWGAFALAILAASMQSVDLLRLAHG